MLINGKYTIGPGANLSGANLSGANLSGANLSGAYLSGAYLSRAYLYHSDLSGAKGIIGGMYRSDWYQFFGVLGHPELMIKAGCRWFTITEARKHWDQTRKGTPLGDETFMILDFLEKLYNHQK